MALARAALIALLIGLTAVGVAACGGSGEPASSTTTASQSKPARDAAAEKRKARRAKRAARLRRERRRARERRAEHRRAARRRAEERRRARERRAAEERRREREARERAQQEAEQSCDPSYEGACLDPNASDYDCAGGSGDGPEYVNGPVSVVGDDHFDLDSDGDGSGCES
jgi:hypothetical protein